mmetsp:Transcript_40513/g.90977  ORF Transcript_40513/g.90977 Transcript_40513/m.90977 type:complete len:335 (+) Transcript_40513:86-1090(+)
MRPCVLAPLLSLLALHGELLHGFASGQETYGTLDCAASAAELVLKSEIKLAAQGLEPATVSIPRQMCKLSFSPTSCAKHSPKPELPPPAQVAELARPKPLVLVVKLGVGSPFEGDRKAILTQVVADCAAHGGVQLVFLVDRSEWTKKGHYEDASAALPAEFKPLVVGYSVADVQKAFPTRELKPRREQPVNVRARAIGKYYETYSWSWWWAAQERTGVHERVWVVEDDTVFTGSWARLLAVLERGLKPLDAQAQAAGGHKAGAGGAGADLVAFRNFCTPSKSWIWARWMHEGWHNLTYPGKGLETWMTAYGLSPRFLDKIVETQKKGVTGHIEW